MEIMSEIKLEDIRPEDYNQEGWKIIYVISKLRFLERSLDKSEGEGKELLKRLIKEKVFLINESPLSTIVTKEDDDSFSYEGLVYEGTGENNIERFRVKSCKDYFSEGQKVVTIIEAPNPLTYKEFIDLRNVLNKQLEKVFIETLLKMSLELTPIEYDKKDSYSKFINKITSNTIESGVISNFYIMNSRALDILTQEGLIQDLFLKGNPVLLLDSYNIEGSQDTGDGIILAGYKSHNSPSSSIYYSEDFLEVSPFGDKIFINCHYSIKGLDHKYLSLGIIRNED